MNRREFVAACSATALGHHALPCPGAAPRGLRAPDHALRIAPIDLELAPGKRVHTIGYNGVVPGPLLRLREGVPVTIAVTNDSDHPEFVHWHGLEIPPEADGAQEQGSKPITPHGGVLQYSFTPRPAGFRWYHSHTFAGRDLSRSTYSGQFGFVYVDPGNDPGGYDQELFLALHDWGPYITGGDDGFENVAYRYSSINDRLLGHGDPIRVREGERVLFHLLNASATDSHWLSLAGHQFTVVAMDGNPVPTQVTLDVVRLDPGERIDAIVTMTNPGVWILGEATEEVRSAGMGIVVEYAGRSGAPRWLTAVNAVRWSYPLFGRKPEGRLPDAQPISLVFQSVFHGHGASEGWAINGKSFPQTDTVRLTQGQRYRLSFNNQCAEDHPVHLHRHTMEIVSVAGQATSGVRKDVIVVPAHSQVDADLVADDPGKALFHCHLQDHMDAGFMMLFDYA
ncbi:MAG TPA: multicopper oxidase family protein [Gemmatimonadales bacterium]|jgi:FtsP/CotA-like multicopper oxidase with cupredoxin domain